MFYIIENQEQFNDLKMSSVGYHFIYPIQRDDRVIPVMNEVIGLYVYSFYLSKAFIINIDHPDCTSITKECVETWLQQLDPIVTANAKLLLAHFNLNYKVLIDLKFQNKDIDNLLCNQKKWYYSLYEKSRSVNKIIPITIHKRFYDQFIPFLQELNIARRNDYESKAIYCFSELERKGIPIDTRVFSQIYNSHDLTLNTDGNTFYSWFNIYNPTLRPTYTFNNVNLSALNKKSGIREGIIARKDCILIEFDFRAYHLYLLANEIGIIPTENIHTYLAKQYFDTEEPTEQEYNDSKGITFNAIYTDNPTYDHIEFIKQAKMFKEALYKERTVEIDKEKILSYYLQRQETIRNVDLLLEVLKHFKSCKSTVILYTYDSFLFNIHKTETELIHTLKELLQSDNYPAKITYGRTYGSMKELE